MKAGADQRKKTILAGVLGAGALVCVFVLYSQLFGGTTTPPPTAPAAVKANPNGTNGTPLNPVKSSTANPTRNASNAVPGVDAAVLAKTSASLDPTLDPEAMLRTENLLYSGTGRNIFSLTYTPPPPVIKGPIPTARNTAPPPAPLPPPPPPTCPPSCPPIGLKFFGTAAHGKGAMQAFLLSGEDVYLASQGDIVARKYKIVSISANSIQVTDLSNGNTQTLPLQAN